jgi:hypothetical protein
LEVPKKFLTFVKQFGEMVGVSVKPWFPNLEKKIKKDLVNQKTLPTFVKQIGRVRNVL